MERENSIQYPFAYQELGPEETKEVTEYLASSFTNAIRLGSTGYFFYKEFGRIILDIYNMAVRPSDIFVLSMPRSGTTWTQELVWLLQNDCDFERAKATPLTMRFPFLESGSLLKVNVSSKRTQRIDISKFIAEAILVDPKSLNKMSSPRFIKSHLPMSLLPPTLLDTAKVVYVARDPRDVAVSFFFHLKYSHRIPNDREFKPFWTFYVQSKVLWCPYFEHVKEAWSQRNHPNMIFLFYEELSKDLTAVARRLATFFGKEYSEEQFKALSDHLKFDNFKDNISVNMKEWQDAGIMSGNFIRKGQPGGWRDHFDTEMTQQSERWIADNLCDTDLRFPPT